MKEGKRMERLQWAPNQAGEVSGTSLGLKSRPERSPGPATTPTALPARPTLLQAP